MIHRDHRRRVMKEEVEPRIADLFAQLHKHGRAEPTEVSFHTKDELVVLRLELEQIV